MSSEPKFSPGPWKVHKHEGTRRVYIEDNAQYAIAECLGVHGTVLKNANANLIAQALDMYALLEEMLDDCVTNGHYFYNEKMEALLAKARGEAAP